MTLKTFLRTAAGLLVLSAGVLIGGGWRDPWLWAYVVTFTAIVFYAIGGMKGDLASERFRPPCKGADAAWLPWIRGIALAHLLIGIADNRFGWTAVPDTLRAVGVAGFALSFLFLVWAMRTNYFFSSVVRIQDERGHHLVDSGPYAHVRHPGYTGMILFAPFSGLALGSWISVAVALIYSAMIVRRVVFEDGFLNANLAGYADYRQRVPYRLVPGVW